MRNRIFITLGIFLFFLVLFLGVDLMFFNKANQKTIIIGAKNRPENHILAEMVSILIEKYTDIKVRRQYNLEGTFICFQAIKAGDIDIYPEFTGTALLAILKEEKILTSEETYNYVKAEFEKRYKLTWLKPFGFTNNYTLVMSKKKANKLGIFSMDDLKNHPKLIYGFNPEFISRIEYKLLRNNYDLISPTHPKIMDHTLLYFSLANDGIDVLGGFTTDPGIAYYDLVVLEDTKKCLPQYHCVPIIRIETLEKYPYLENVINKLANTITEEEMQKMNYLIDYKEIDCLKIARDFLIKKNLI